MSRYIDADALQKQIEKRLKEECEQLMNEIKKFDTKGGEG